MEKAYIGVDLGGTSIRVACTDSCGRIILQKDAQTFKKEDLTRLEDRVILLIEEILRSPAVQEYAVKSIGMGIPGVYYNGEVLMSPNIGNMKAGSIVSHFAAKYGLPFSIMNDVKCAALGEQWLGIARDTENLIFLNIGTGLSLALILNGKVHMGAENASGEIAYWIFDPEAEAGYGSGRAPLEEIFSGKGIADSVKAEMGQTSGHWDTKRIFEAYRQGNAEIIRILDAAIRHFTVALANISILLNPDMIVFGGSVSDSMDIFIDGMKEYFQRMVPFPPSMKKSALEGNAGLYGAVRLAIMSEKMQG